MAVWLWNFWIFSFWGWCLERLLAAVTPSPRQRRRCLLVSPLCPVYGLGMAAVLALPAPLLSGWRLYCFGSLAATAVEYLYHWWGDCFLRVRFWDYTSVPGNLRGRVCLPFSLAWGLLMFPAVKLAAPAAAAPHLAVPDGLCRRRGVFPPLSGRHPRPERPAVRLLKACQLPVDRIPAMGACPSRGFLLECRYRKHKGDCYGTQ